MCALYVCHCTHPCVCMHVCVWVPGISWGVNHGSFSLNSSGLGGTSGAHTTCCERVAGPPANF